MRSPLDNVGSTRGPTQLIRAAFLEPGDRALLNGGHYQAVESITDSETPGVCVVGTDGGVQMRLWAAHWVVVAR